MPCRAGNHTHKLGILRWWSNCRRFRSPARACTPCWGMRMRRSSLVYHVRAGATHRIGFAQHWAVERGEHCDPTPAPRVSCTYRSAFQSCSGASWLRCTNDLHAYAASNCSLDKRELKREAASWHAARKKAIIK